MRRIAGIAAAVAALTAATVLAQEGPGMGPPADGRRPGQKLVEMEGRVLHWLGNNPKAAEELGLSADQVKTIKAEAFALQKEVIDLRAKIETAALKQAELMSAEEIDEAAVMKAIEETGRLRSEMAKASIRHMLAVRKALSPEQRTKLKELMHRRAQEMKESRGRRMPGGERQGGPVPPTPPPQE